MRRLLAIAAASTVLLAVAPPATAQTGPSASLGGVTNNQTVNGYVNLVAKGSSAAGISKIEIKQNGVTIRSQSYGGLKTSETLSHTWDTRGLANAAYALKAIVTATAGGSNNAEVRVYVNNPAATPTGVSASFNGDSVVVSWNANPEPDIQSYVVERDSGGGWNSIGSTSSTSMTDNPGSGNHSYRVSAVRYSPTNGSNTSTPSGGDSVTVPKSSSGSTGSGAGGDGSAGGSGSGGSVPGYGGGGKGSKKGKSGAGSGSGSSGSGGSVYGGIGFAGGRRLGSLGLPGRLRVPGVGGAARAEISGNPEWGAFDENLPYNIPDGIEVTEQVPGGLSRIAAVTPRRIIPPDGLRWVAAGLWLLVTSLLLLSLERRLARRELEERAGLETAPAPVLARADAVAENVAAHVETETRFVDVVALNIAAHAETETRFVDVVAQNIAAHEDTETRFADVVAQNADAGSTSERSEGPSAPRASQPGARKRTAGRGTERTRTVKRTARKRTAAQWAAATAKRRANEEARDDRSVSRSHKTTTARKPPRPGGKRIRATKARSELHLVKNDSAAA